jgi:iturin family lipopeptide synthetase A
MAAAALDEKLTATIGALARRHATTPYVILLAAFRLLLARYSGSEEGAILTLATGRSRPEYERTLGPFINTLLMRVRAPRKGRFTELLRAVREWVLGALENRDVPFERLLTDSTLARGEGRRALEQTMFVYLPPAPLDTRHGPLTMHVSDVHPSIAKFDLMIAAVHRGERIEILVQADQRRFSPEATALVHEHYRKLLSQVVREPDLPLARYTLDGG